MLKNAEFYQAVLNAMPMPVFILDDELRVRHLNRSAQQFFELGQDPSLNGVAGELLQCLYANGGCGHAGQCENCVVRQAAQSRGNNENVIRRRLKFSTKRAGRIRELEMLLTATATTYDGSAFTLMVLEDITELTMLKTLLPICMHCKKIRDDRQYWQHVESYFHRYIGVDFSHGICPECVEKVYRVELSQIENMRPNDQS